MKKVSSKKVLISEHETDEIGERIAWLRKEKNLSLSRFASLISVSKGNLSDIEKNRYKPSYQTIVKITDKFNVNAVWLIKGEGNPYSQDEGCDNFILKDSVNEIVDLTLKIGELDKSMLNDITDFLRDKFLTLIRINDRRREQRRIKHSGKSSVVEVERRKESDRRGVFFNDME